MSKKDFLAGGLVTLIGLAAALQGWQYDFGTLIEIGPGFMPVTLGVLMMIVGLAIAFTGAASNDVETADPPAARPSWVGWSAILAGPLLFILLGRLGGLVPATFACVFVSALGDRNSTYKSSFALAAGVTVLGVVLFSIILRVPMPMLQWGWQ